MILICFLAKHKNRIHRFTVCETGKFTISLKPGDKKKYTITKNRAVLSIHNGSYNIISEILLRKDESSDWTENLLEGYLEPNVSVDYPLETEYRFLKILDVYFTEYPVEEIELVAGEYYHYTFTGTAK